MGRKHKKEHKKKKHRSPVSSDSFDEKDKKRHHKKKHKDKRHCKKKRDSSSPDIPDEVIELDTPSPPPPPSISRDVKTPPPPSRKRPASPKGWSTPPKIAKVQLSPPKEPHKSPGGTPPPPATSRDSLSIEETNALRIKLGMKPLQVEPKPVAPPTTQPLDNGNSSSTPDVILIEGEEGQFVHKPAESLTHKKESDKLRARLAERKEKREIEKKYKKLKTLGDDSDGDDSATAWVKKSRKIDEEKQKAARKAQELDEMDKLFGISDLIEDEIKKEKKDAYGAKSLKGLKVEHDINSFEEDKNIILTLKDSDVLNEEESDTLVNVNMMDDERYKKNLLNKKLKPNSNLYDDEDEFEFGERSVLKKYDEEIGGEKKSSFVLGVNKAVITKDKVKEKLRANMKLESLDTKIEMATDYYTSEEMVKFKKPKKVRKIRKKPLKADDLLKMNANELSYGGNDLGSRRPKGETEIDDALDVDDTPALPMDTDEVPFKVEVKEEETELSLALKKARKLRQIKDKPLPSYLDIGEKIKQEIKEEVMDEDDVANSIVLNSTAEFCRTLGDIPTYGLAGNREEVDQLTDQMDFDRDMKRDGYRNDEDENEGGWQDAEMDHRVVDISNIEAEPILDAEPDLGSGVAGALHLAVSKGYLEKETVNRPNAARCTHLQAQNYSIEDKAHGEDEKFGNRRDRYMGPLSDFKEKDNYKPNIKLEYIDDDGRILSAKEAFRYLSHKFHGKGPGKNKIEKRMKKNEQEVLMKQMSSSDTPLGTLQMLQSKQVETQSPFVVLSGSKHQLSAPTSISKSKFK